MTVIWLKVLKFWYLLCFLLINHYVSYSFLRVDYRLMNEFIEAIGEFKMKTQRISNLTPVSIIRVPHAITICHLCLKIYKKMMNLLFHIINQITDYS